MAKIIKAEQVFKPLTAVQKQIAEQNFRRSGSLKGKIILGRGDIFNLKISSMQ